MPNSPRRRRSSVSKRDLGPRDEGDALAAGVLEQVGAELVAQVALVAAELLAVARGQPHRVLVGDVGAGDGDDLVLVHLAGELAGDLDRPDLRLEGAGERPLDEAGELRLQVAQHAHSSEYRGLATAISPATIAPATKPRGRARSRRSRASRWPTRGPPPRPCAATMSTTRYGRGPPTGGSPRRPPRRRSPGSSARVDRAPGELGELQPPGAQRPGRRPLRERGAAGRRRPGRRRASRERRATGSDHARGARISRAGTGRTASASASARLGVVVGEQHGDRAGHGGEPADARQARGPGRRRPPRPPATGRRSARTARSPAIDRRAARRAARARSTAGCARASRPDAGRRRRPRRRPR